MAKISILKRIFSNAQHGLDFLLNEICLDKNLDFVLTHKNKTINTISRSLGRGFGALPISAQLIARVLTVMCQTEIRELSPNTYFLEIMTERERINITRFISASILCNIIPALILIGRAQYIGRKDKMKRDFIAHLIDFLGRDINIFCRPWHEKFFTRNITIQKNALPKIGVFSKFGQMYDFVTNAAHNISTNEENALKVIDSLRSRLNTDSTSIEKIFSAFGYNNESMIFFNSNQNDKIDVCIQYYAQKINFCFFKDEQYIFHDASNKNKQTPTNDFFKIEASLNDTISQTVSKWYQSRLNGGMRQSNVRAFEHQMHASQNTLQIIQNDIDILNKLLMNCDILIIGESHIHIDYLDWISRSVNNSEQNIILMMEEFSKGEELHYTYKASHSLNAVYKSKHIEYVKKILRKNILVYGMENDFFTCLLNALEHLRKANKYNMNYRKELLIKLLRIYIKKLETKEKKLANFPDGATFYNQKRLYEIKNYLQEKLILVEHVIDVQVTLCDLCKHFFMEMQASYRDKENYMKKRTEANKSMVASILKKLAEEPGAKIIVTTGASHVVDYKSNYPGLYTALLNLSHKNIRAFVFNNKVESPKIEYFNDSTLEASSMNPIASVPYSYFDHR